MNAQTNNPKKPRAVFIVYARPIDSAWAAYLALAADDKIQFHVRLDRVRAEAAGKVTVTP